MTAATTTTAAAVPLGLAAGAPGRRGSEGQVAVPAQLSPADGLQRLSAAAPAPAPPPVHAPPAPPAPSRHHGGPPEAPPRAAERSSAAGPATADGPGERCEQRHPGPLPLCLRAGQAVLRDALTRQGLGRLIAAGAAAPDDPAMAQTLAAAYLQVNLLTQAEAAVASAIAGAPIEPYNHLLAAQTAMAQWQRGLGDAKLQLCTAVSAWTTAETLCSHAESGHDRAVATAARHGRRIATHELMRLGDGAAAAAARRASCFLSPQAAHLGVPRVAAPEVLAADDLAAAGELAAAEAALRAALAACPGNPELQLALATLLCSLHRYEAAQPLLAELHGRDPQDAAVRYLYASALSAAAEPEADARAEALLRGATCPAGAGNTPGLAAKVHAALAELLAGSDRLAEASEFCAVARDLDPDSARLRAVHDRITAALSAEHERWLIDLKAAAAEAETRIAMEREELRVVAAEQRATIAWESASRIQVMNREFEAWRAELRTGAAAAVGGMGIGFQLAGAAAHGVTSLVADLGGADGLN